MAIKTKKHPEKPLVEKEPVGITFLKLAAAGVGVIILLVVLAALFFIPTTTVVTYETPFETCIAAGNPMLKTYPPKCVWPGGQTVVQIIPGVNDIDSFEDCADAGYPIMESYPEQCRTFDGKTFVKSYTGYCATTISYEGDENDPNPYAHQRKYCGELTNQMDCTNGGTPEWLEANAPFSCEWQSTN